VVEVDWGSDQEKTYPMTIQVHAFDRKGLIKDISSMLTEERINVLEMNTRTEKKDQSVTMEMMLEVGSLELMSKLLAKLDQLPNIMSVKRKI
jgi:GTP pyrophosphokinase